MNIEIPANIDVTVCCSDCGVELEIWHLVYFQDELEVTVSPHTCEEE